MILTNNENLPEPLFRAIENDDYNPGDCDITVTQLVNPARQGALMRHHRAVITEDAADKIWIVLGKMGHKVLEQAAMKEVVEERLFHDFMGWKISGQMDIWLPRKEILDYKFTSAWAVKDGVKPEWEAQLNLYRWLALNQEKPFEVESLKIVAILRDWSKIEASKNGDYPPRQVKVLPVKVWTDAELLEYLKIKVNEHQSARASLANDGIIPLPECTEAERWVKPTKYAAMKGTNKRALKVCDTNEQAAAVSGCTHVDIRLGAWTRCENYCPVKEFCSQWKLRTQLDESDVPA
jgi:hypothetical protein